MKLYHYARDGRYIGTSKAEKDPQDKSEWIVPAGATTNPTPGKAKPGMHWQWGGSSWQMRPDEAVGEAPAPAEPAPSGKQRYWKPNGQAMEVSVNAKLPDDAILEPPPSINSPQVVRYQDGKWVVLADHRGFAYFDEKGNRHVIREIGIEPPANALNEPPPVPGENEARVLRDGEWEIVPDFTGQQYWLEDGTKLPPLKLGETPPDSGLDHPPTLAELKAWKINDVTVRYTSIMRKLVDGYPAIERESFMSQETEAKAYLAAVRSGEVPDTPTLSAILVGRNGAGGKETLEELSRKVLGHAEAFHSAQYHTGQRQRLIKQIEAATTADAVRAVK